jgi:hypothetical protein
MRATGRVPSVRDDPSADGTIGPLAWVEWRMRVMEED